jgi:hypothetical protein
MQTSNYCISQVCGHVSSKSFFRYITNTYSLVCQDNVGAMVLDGVADAENYYASECSTEARK